MRQPFNTIRDVIDLWHTTPLGRKRRANIALAIDLEIPASVVRSMRHRNSINKKYWHKLIEAAKRHAQDPDASELFALVDAQVLVELSTPTVLDASDSEAVDSVPVLAA